MDESESTYMKKKAVEVTKIYMIFFLNVWSDIVIVLLISECYRALH